MKKAVLSTLLAACLLLGMAACGSDGGPVPEGEYRLHYHLNMTASEDGKSTLHYGKIVLHANGSFTACSEDVLCPTGDGSWSAKENEIEIRLGDQTYYGTVEQDTVILRGSAQELRDYLAEILAGDD